MDGLKWRNELSPETKRLLIAVERMGKALGTGDMSWMDIHAANPIDWINLVVQMKQLLDKDSSL